MRNGRYSWLRCVYIVSSFALQGMSMASSLRAACYSTPRAAIDALVTNSSSPPSLENGGYQVTSIQSDQVLGQRWAIIARCGHPEWPVSALPASGIGSLVSPQKAEHFVTEGLRTVPVVRAGDMVQLWRRESLLRIEVVGISEESGGLGKTIRVRLLPRNTDDQAVPEQVSGVVRGPSNVEMQP